LGCDAEDLESKRPEKDRRLCFLDSAVVGSLLEELMPSRELSLNLTILGC
jgi:hypothetical protein